MELTLLLVVLVAWSLPLFLTRQHQSLWYYLLAGLVLLSSLLVIDLTVWLFLSTLPLNFLTLFVFRYTRLVVNIVGFFLYKPAAVLHRPTFKPSDVSVIIPTVEGEGAEFLECIGSVFANMPAKIIIVTGGPDVYNRALKSVGAYENIVIKNCSIQNKRRQVCFSLQEVTTPITVLCDDHVFWPPSFLPHLLAPFEDPTVGSVGTRKRVRRTHTTNTRDFFSLSSFFNLLGCLFLERHNFEITASNALDGGVFVISGRTSAHRSDVLLSPPFQSAFVNEYVVPFPDIYPFTNTSDQRGGGGGGLIGPLNADDDNFITRYMILHDRRLKFQYADAATVETTLGTYPKFLAQCLRWSRTTWRSNPRLLLHPLVWRRQPYSVYAVYISTLVNFALVWDPLLLYTFRRSGSLMDKHKTETGTILLLSWMVLSKIVKTMPHFRRHPRDLVWLPACILFGYVHSVLKLWALVTFWDVKWEGRVLVDDGGEGSSGEGGVSKKKKKKKKKKSRGNLTSEKRSG